MRQFSITTFILIFFLSHTAFGASPAISTSPQNIIQGEPLMIVIENPTGIVKRVTFDAKPIDVFLYKSKLTALVGVDLNKKAGTYEVAVEFYDGQTIRQNIVIGERKKIEAPLGIPEKLGGNTPAAQKQLVTSLANENTILSSLSTGRKSFWTEKFRFPLPTQIITDPYGYSRETGSYTIAHKGTDFRAKEGTNVYAMNRGVVRYARQGTIYGKTIVVDHGLGLMTMYMHLSKMNVVEGQLVLPGQLIGLSGQTGYAEAPHLHVSVRINNISIDPMRFMEFFK